MIIEKVIQDYDHNSSLVFFKDTPQLIITKSLSYPENTEVEYGDDSLLHLTNCNNAFLNNADLFFSEVIYYLPIKTIELLAKHAKRTKQNIYELYLKNPYLLLNIKTKDGLDILSILDICKIFNPVTFEGRKLDIYHMLTYTINTLKNHTGSTCFTFDSIYFLLNSYLKQANKTITKEELSAYLNYYSKYFFFNQDNFNDNTWISLIEDYQHENLIYTEILNRKNLPSPFSRYKAPHIDNLSDEQNDAVQNIVSSPGLISILSGGPGTGKTTIIQKIVEFMKLSYPSEEIALLAPTGRAAKRISEVMTYCDIKINTIHKFLGFRADEQPLPDKEREEMIKNTHLIIIDEASMLGVSLLYSLLEVIDREHTKIILVGDIHQLPSIEPGYVLRDLQYLNVPLFMLNINFRSNGSIDKNAKLIQAGLTNLIYDDYFKLCDDNICLYLDEVIDNYDFDTIFLSPYRKNRESSTDYINQLAHNKKFENINYYIKFAPGDKVLITRTQYKKESALYINGDVGIVQTSTLNEDGLYEYEICLSDYSLVKVPEEDLDYAYALSIHKSQGSEYPIVHITIPEFSEFITRKMLYTAITRAKQHVIIHSTKTIIDQIIQNNSDYNRDTILQKKIECVL